MKHKNLTIIGTSHIAKQSLEDVERHITEKKPDIVALELDKKRLSALLSKKKDKIRLYDIKRIGFKGYIFALIGAWAEKKLGNLVGVTPGSEMLRAINLAKKNKIQIALIDQDIEITLRRFSKTLTWKEKWNFLVDIIKALFFRKNVIEFDLTKVPSKKVIKKLIDKVRIRYPNIYNVLIKERNEVMAHNLAKLMDKYEDKDILAVVGAGHEEDIISIIKAQITYTFKLG